MNLLQKAFGKFRAPALASFGETVEIDGKTYSCIPADGTATSEREDGGYFAGDEMALTVFRSDYENGRELLNKILTFRGKSYRVSNVEDQVQVAAWELKLAEPDA